MNKSYPAHLLSIDDLLENRLVNERYAEKLLPDDRYNQIHE